MNNLYLDPKNKQITEEEQIEIVLNYSEYDSPIDEEEEIASIEF